VNHHCSRQGVSPKGSQHRKTVAWVIQDGALAQILQKLIKTTLKLFHNTKGTSYNIDWFAVIGQ
jgi:hypothetical protein